MCIYVYTYIYIPLIEYLERENLSDICDCIKNKTKEYKHVCVLMPKAADPLLALIAAYDGRGQGLTHWI